MNKAFEKILEMLEATRYIAQDDSVAELIRTRIWNKALHKAKQIVKKVAEEYNGGWIPADETPGTGSYVLLSFSNFSIPMVGRYDEEEAFGGAYYIGDEVVSCVSQDLFVNAWQPLPEPYKESD